MTAIKPIQITVAELIRDFNAGHSKFRTATALADEIVSTVREHDRTCDTKITHHVPPIMILTGENGDD
jgi:hypothetical protein